MEMVLLVLILGLFVQIGLVLKKMGSIQRLEEVSKIEELKLYAQNRQYGLTDDRGLDTLMIASEAVYESRRGEPRYTDVVREALDRGFDLNATSLSEGKTALMYAVRSGNLERAELLIQSGADVDVEDANGRTVLFDAVKKSKDAFYTLLADRVTSVDTQDSYGVTPLMIAAYEMNLSRLEDLLERGASIRLKNKAGENASDIARKHLHRHIRRVVASENKDEGSPHNTTTTEDVLKAQKYNHELREMVRRMECLADGRSYEYKKFKRPFLRTQKAN